jgi:quinol monooxygenase YgiN
MGHVVIACYKPKPGQDAALRELMRTHVDMLRGEDLVTDRAPIQFVAQDGTCIEVFEWQSTDAVDRAHSNPTVMQMWQQFEAVCDYVPIAQVPEAAQIFSGFNSIDVAQ